MAPKKNLRSTDLRAAGKLTVDAVNGITDIVEALYATIWRLGGVVPSDKPHRSGGISGFIFAVIRAISRFSGHSFDFLLNRLQTRLGEWGPSPNRDIALAVLNGVLGDFLHERQNPLAIPMQLRQGGEAISPEELAAQLSQGNRKLLLMVHGLCMNDRQWLRKGHDHGQRLADTLSAVPVYLHYNSGRHISENGRDLAELLHKYSDFLPENTKIYLLGHSLGGLVARSAFHYGTTAAHQWPAMLKKVVFLGTPHFGAPLERAGNWIDILLDSNPYSAPFARLGKIRSCGITDLRHGYLLASDWEGKDRFKPLADLPTPLPLPNGPTFYAIAATAGKKQNTLNLALIGDGLVTASSALGLNVNPEKSLAFLAENRKLYNGMSHLGLLNRLEVYWQILKWLEEE